QQHCCGMGSETIDVRFGSEADILDARSNVRFTPESGHFQRQRSCPLSAISGHRRFEPDGLADLIQLYVQAGANDVQLVFDFGAQEYGPEATLVDSSLRQCHAMLTC
ncbi:MAG: hypothetical protein ABUJ98_11105, partial [Hyphomicrobium sp.]